MFESARLKVERAHYHIGELIATYREFFENDTPYELLCDIEPDSQKFGLRVEVTQNVPFVGAIIIGDIFHNLRSALDHLAVELESKTPSPRKTKHIKFPTHETRENFVSEVEKGIVYATFPETGKAIRDTVNCCKTGNRVLWTIGKINNIDKHRFLVTHYSVTKVSGVHTEDEGGNIVINQTFNVEGSGYCGAFSSSRKINIKNKGNAVFDVNFGEVGLLEGDPVIPTLIRASNEVTKTIDIIQEALLKDLITPSS